MAGRPPVCRLRRRPLGRWCSNECQSLDRVAALAKMERDLLVGPTPPDLACAKADGNPKIHLNGHYTFHSDGQIIDLKAIMLRPELG